MNRERIIAELSEKYEKGVNTFLNCYKEKERRERIINEIKGQKKKNQNELGGRTPLCGG
jgi:hypothetical protein